MSNERLPYIFILDWDGTIAGRVDFQCQKYTLHATLKKHGVKLPNAAIPSAFYPEQGLIRPGFSNFLMGAQSLFPNAFFFVYTASEKQWALQEIAWMEKTHNVHLDRPIFTRDDCIVDSSGNFRKSIKNVAPRIFRYVSKKMKHKFTTREKEYVLHRHMLIIDDNSVYLDRQDRLLLCPRYNYIYYDNIVDQIPEKLLKHPVINQQILQLVNSDLICPMLHHQGGGAGDDAGATGAPGASGIVDPMEKMAKYHSWVANKCAAIIKVNNSSKNDVFWKLLRKLLEKNSIKEFTQSIIQQLQGILWKHYGRS